MAQQSNIVSFDEVRRNARLSASRRPTRTQEGAGLSQTQDSENLSNIFRLDFGEEAIDGSMTRQAPSDRPRQAFFTEEDLQEEEGVGTDAPRGAFAKLAKRVGDARKARSKAQAEQAFEKAYGGMDVPAGGSEGPRAAIHEPKMTASQKKAAKARGTHGAGGFGGISIPGLSRFKLPQLSGHTKRTVMAVTFTFFAVMLVGSIYTPAQQYYQQIRERDRLSAEYTAVQERNEALQSTVDYLSTEDGLEDKAHTEFGLIKPDEETASVIGLDVDAKPDLHANVPPGSVPAPETWYSGVLDVLFLYDRG